MAVIPRRLPSLAALTDARTLSAVLDATVTAVRCEPLQDVGYSNASLSRVTVATQSGGRTFVLKHTVLARDWTARRTADGQGREALLLDTPDLAAVWTVFECPYVAFASQPGEVGLLLEDLTPALLPDVRAPLTDAQEQALLGALARLHARFWGDAAPSHGWLARPRDYCWMLGASIVDDPSGLGLLPPAMQEAVSHGWKAAIARLPPAAARLLTCAGADWESAWADLPRTLVHGDVKVANFALATGRGAAAFDWAMVGVGPCAIDVGWYLAVNASRLTGSKEATLTQYRTHLEHALARRVPEATWSRLTDAAVICGARMLLWSKAHAVEHGRPGAEAEWTWWADRLADIGSR
jgi:phosphotransferase family enzyme